MEMEDFYMKKNRWVKPVIIAAVIIALIIAGVQIVPGMLSGRGVQASTEDILLIVNACKPYLIGIGAAIAVWLLIFILTAPKKTNAKTRFVLRRQSLIACLLIVLLMVNLICNGPVSALLNVSMGAKGEMSEETREESFALAQKIAEEGIVLLENRDNALPLEDVTKLNVFGWASTNPIYGGTGSGEFSDTSSMVTLLQGLEEAGFELNQELIDFYIKDEDERPQIGIYIQDWTVTESKLKDMNRKKLFESAAEFSDVALMVLSRSGGEGADLPVSITDENTIAQAATLGTGRRFTSQKEDIDPSKSYLEPTARELAVIEELNKTFGTVIVIVNSANTMELGWVSEYENIKGVIWCAGAGQTGFRALGEVLRGTVNPSGKTVDTYVYDVLSIPVINNIGAFVYDNADDLCNADGTDTYHARFVNYVEGIYVGYRFYETAAEEGLIDYDSVVQYPFGYGLSYTAFEKKLDSVEEKNGTVTVKATVTNTGNVAGKDVVEIYYTPPYVNGGIEKASVNLIDFGKTELLEPGKSQTLELNFTLEDMASYDYREKGCYVLEAGEYLVSLRNDSHTVIDTETVTVDKEIVYGEGSARTSDKKAAINTFDYAAGEVEYLSRADHFANYETATAAPLNYSMSDSVKEGFITLANYDVTQDTDTAATMPTTGAKGSLTLADLAGREYGDSRWNQLLDQLTVAEMSNLISMGGYMTTEVSSIQLDATIETDGPSGLHSNFTALEGTSFPSPVMLASTWNKELAERKGELVGRQGQELGITGWYGPAMNIHRSAFSGRNFEYYSEDPVLSGIMALNEVTGARLYGMQTYVKHFALNDQEEQRTGMICVWSNEQAIREIYLKPFEMAIKQGKPTSVMSSYNYIGNKWAGACNELLIDVLRDEWGFEGVVVTDWYGGYGYMNSDLSIRNGGSRMLTTTDMAKLTDTESATAVSAMREATHGILYSLVNSSLYAGVNRGLATWKKILYAADAAVIALAVLLEVVFFIKLKKKDFGKVKE